MLRLGAEFAVLVVALATVSCSHGVSRIQTLSLPSPNLTTYKFPLLVQEVHTRALQAFSRDQQRHEAIFPKPTKTANTANDVSWESILSAECSTNALYNKAAFADSANAHDIYLHSSHTPFVASAVYRGRHGGLPFIATFRLHLTGRGSNTVVTVTAFDAEVINGTKFGIGSCGPGQHWNCVKVEPTTVEEYTVLRYLGRHLGVTNMPTVILPAL